MSNATCNYKREKNPKPILPLCRLNEKCEDFHLESHRKIVYHTAFANNHKERLDFLLKASRFSLEEKKKNSSFSGRYLWEQFSCDLKDETYYNFLTYCFNYIIDNSKTTSKEFLLDLMILSQTFITLEEDAVTGIFYLNKGFMMWIFQFLKYNELLNFLKDKVPAMYGIDFRRILKLINENKRIVNRIVLEQLDTLDERTLKNIYSEFMLTNKYKIFAEQKGIVPLERKIINFQKSLKDLYNSNNSIAIMIDPITISNSALVSICRLLLKQNNINISDIITGFLN